MSESISPTTINMRETFAARLAECSDSAAALDERLRRNGCESSAEYSQRLLALVADHLDGNKLKTAGYFLEAVDVQIGHMYSTYLGDALEWAGLRARIVALRVLCLGTTGGAEFAPVAHDLTDRGAAETWARKMDTGYSDWNGQILNPLFLLVEKSIGIEREIERRSSTLNRIITGTLDARRLLDKKRADGQ